MRPFPGPGRRPDLVKAWDRPLRTPAPRFPVCEMEGAAFESRKGMEEMPTHLLGLLSDL